MSAAARSSGAGERGGQVGRMTMVRAGMPENKAAARAIAAPHPDGWRQFIPGFNPRIHGTAMVSGMYVIHRYMER